MSDPDLESSGHDGALPVIHRFSNVLRRNALLLTGIIAVMVIGPAFSRYISAFRGIILEVKGDKMFIGLGNVPPKWVDSIEAQPGSIVVKETGSWQAATVDRVPADHALVALHKRYQRTYWGTIIRINPPRAPGGASTAVIELEDGSREHLQLWATHLATAEVGRRVHKSPGSWDPELVEDGPPAK